jgi:hypothetical protein
VATATFDLGLDTSRVSGITLFGTIDGFHDVLNTYYYTDFSLFGGFAEFTGTGIVIATFRADNGVTPTDEEFEEFGAPTGPDFSTDVSPSDVAKILSAVQSSGGVLSLDMTGNVFSQDGRGGQGGVAYLENVGLIVHEIPAVVPEPSGLWLLGSGGLVVSLMAAWNRFPRRHGDDRFRSRKLGRIRLPGALPSTKSCITCHHGSRGFTGGVPLHLAKRPAECWSRRRHAVTADPDGAPSVGLRRPPARACRSRSR